MNIQTSESMGHNEMNSLQIAHAQIEHAEHDVHTQAVARAKCLMGVEPTDEAGESNLYFKVKSGFVLQYRAHFQDWVTWRPSQLEGTLRGGDERFLVWANKMIAALEAQPTERKWNS